MRHCSALIGLLILSIVTIVAAWSPEDHEIFRLRDEVLAHEGENTTFYSFVGVKPSATTDDINKAYRKQSRNLHPDKARQQWLASYNVPKASSKPGSKPKVQTQKDKKPSQREVKAFEKEASARFARLGVVTNILRGPERERYDHFLYNGFPKWRGTGYYYQRYRPGLGSVLIGLFIFAGGAVHYVALYIGWKRQREFVERYIKHARRTAWGDEGALNAIPGIGDSAPATNGSLPTPAESEEEGPQSMNWNRREKRAAAKEKAKEGKKPSKAKAAKAVQKAQTDGISTPQEAEITSGPVGAKKRTRAQNGKVLIVDSVGNVFLEEETEEGDLTEFLLDPDEIHKPTIFDTVLFKGPLFVYNKSIGRLLNKQTVDAEFADVINVEQTQDNEQALNAATASNANGEARKRKGKARPRGGPASSATGLIQPS